jgi:hypothetical protein
LNEELLALKNSTPEIDLSNFLTKNFLFKEGDIDKSIEIDKGHTVTEKTNIYLGGTFKGIDPISDSKNIIIGYGSFTKLPHSIILGTQAYTDGYQCITIGNSSIGKSYW